MKAAAGSVASSDQGTAKATADAASTRPSSSTPPPRPSHRRTKSNENALDEGNHSRITLNPSPPAGPATATKTAQMPPPAPQLSHHRRHASPRSGNHHRRQVSAEGLDVLAQMQAACSKLKTSSQLVA